MSTSEHCAEHPERRNFRSGGDSASDSLAAFLAAGQQFLAAAGQSLRPRPPAEAVTYLGARRQTTGQ